MKSPLYFAKILLFGEYGIIENSKGLSVPFSYYKGSLKFDTTNEYNASNESLKRFLTYLQSLELPEKYTLHLTQLQTDIENGLYFDSTIPQGFGVGSSGALVAAVFDSYLIQKIDKDEVSKDQILELKKILGLMESFFHGSSSGTDPLICFLNIPILIESKTSVDKIGIPAENKEGKGAVFLINSGSPGETGPMVQLFFEKLKHQGFRNTLKKEFIKYNNACIDAFISQDFNPLFQNLKALSTWALVHFKPMIPKRLLHAWEEGIKTNAYYLKLCGSGGGGYILGFTQDYEKAKELLKEFPQEVVYRF